MAFTDSHEVVVTDIRMPFWSMVGFMIKWAIAAIPAFIILGALGVACALLFGGVIAGLNSAMTPAPVSAPRSAVPSGWVVNPNSPDQICRKNDPTVCRSR